MSSILKLLLAGAVKAEVGPVRLRAARTGEQFHIRAGLPELRLFGRTLSLRVIVTVEE